MQQEKRECMVRFIPLLVIAGVVSVLVWAGVVLRSTAVEHQRTFLMVRDVMALDAMSHELLFAQQERGVEQWRRSYGRMKGHLAEGALAGGAGSFRDQLNHEIGEMGPIFEEFLALAPAEVAEGGRATDQKRFLVGQLRTRLATVVKVVESRYEASEQRLQSVVMWVGAIFLLMAVVLFLLSLGVHRSWRNGGVN
jgi:hypothetical protein